MKPVIGSGPSAGQRGTAAGAPATTGLLDLHMEMTSASVAAGLLPAGRLITWSSVRESHTVQAKEASKTLCTNLWVMSSFIYKQCLG